MAKSTRADSPYVAIWYSLTSLYSPSLKITQVKGMSELPGTVVAASARPAQVVQVEQRVGLAALLEQVGDFRSGRTLARSIYPGDQDTIGITPAHRPSLRPSAPGPPFATPAVASEDVAPPHILPHEDDSLGVFCHSP